MKRNQQTVSHSIKCKFEGKEYRGTYMVEKRCVTVTCKFGQKGDVFGSLGAEKMAQHLFSEILTDAKREREGRIGTIERQLAMAQQELEGWKRNGSQVHIAMNTNLYCAQWTGSSQPFSFAKAMHCDDFARAASWHQTKTTPTSPTPGTTRKGSL